MPSAKTPKDTTPRKAAPTPKDIARRVQERVDAEAVEAPKAKPVEPLSDRFVLECLRANRVGDAILFNTLHRGKHVFVERWGRFLRWGGHHWREDMNNSEALAAVENVCTEYLRVASNLYTKAKDLEKDELKANENAREELRKRVFLLRDTSGRSRLLECTRTTPTDRLAIDGEELDQQPYLLAFQNGVIDLRNGSFRPGLPEDYILNACSIEWASLDADAQLWEDFLLSCHDGNREVVDFLQRLLGYGIMGVRDDHVWTVFYGARGRNGKDTLLKVLVALLGSDLAGVIPTEMLLESKMPRNPGAPSPDVMSLRGKRLAFASEAEDNQRIAMGKVKALTGGSFIQGRGLQDKHLTTWRQSHLLFLLTNEIPRIKADDDAFWTRLLAVPWKIRFVDNPTTPDERPRDPQMEQKLLKCLPGIAAWLVRGALEYQEKGLAVPESILECARERRASFDDVGSFLHDCCDIEPPREGGGEPSTRIGASELLDAFNWWFYRERDKSYSYSAKRFGEVMNKKRFDKKKSGGIVYLGVCLKDDVAADFAAWQDAQETRSESKRKGGKLFG